MFLLKKTISIILLSLFSISLSANEEFKATFEKAKSHLLKYELDKAIPHLAALNKMEPENANVKYLMGVCYAEKKLAGNTAINLLSSVTDKINKDYDPKSWEEKDVPTYVYYYLCMAYVANDMCEEAQTAKENFLKVHFNGFDFYTEDVKRLTARCITNNKVEPIKASEIVVEEEVKKEEIVETEEANEIITKKSELSTNTPVYGVQIGAFSKFFPLNTFNEIKSVIPYQDKNGMIRYVVGSFTFKSQADRVLDIVQRSGFSDAFIVNINQTKLYGEEVVIVNNESVHKNIHGKVDYRVQIGSFTSLNDDALREIYFNLKDIREIQENKKTIITSGSFPSYEEAIIHRDSVRTKGFEDAFVVACNYTRKISLKDAEIYLINQKIDNKN